MAPRYQVALSFAGEDRPYVEQVAQHLREQGVQVFYDAYEEAALWGKDLYVHLRDVYEHSASFTVMFISQHYAAKLWTNHERQSAQARALAERREYILPVRFDDTAVPGLTGTIGYIDIRNKLPSELCALIVSKLRTAGVLNAPLPRHRLVEGFSHSQEEALFHATLYQDHQYPHLGVAITPARYSTIGELLDEIYSSYLSPYLDPFTYGSDWVVEGGSFDDLIMVPWQWIARAPCPVHEIAVDWYKQSLAQMSIVPGTSWRIQAVSDRARGMTTRSLGKSYLLATNDETTWKVVLSNAKASALLTRQGYFRVADLDDSIATNHKYVGVFRDWLSIGSDCAWVHTGKKLSPDLLRLLRYDE
jgi:hypothetical protein